MVINEDDPGKPLRIENPELVGLQRPIRMNRNTAALLLSGLVWSLASSSAAGLTELQTLIKEAGRYTETKAGQKYEERFMQAISPEFGNTLRHCSGTTPDTKEPAMIAFVIGKDGTVQRVLYSAVPFGECMGAKFRKIKKVPPPPQDSWVIAFGAANHWAEERSKGPPDKPFGMTRKQMAEYEKVIAPHVAKARATYPAAKKRYLAGLPARYRFSIQVPLFDRNGTREDSFVLVEKIKDGNVTGKIQSELIGVKEFKTGQRITVPESKIVNWVILRPDGVEEGNYVGKFLDHHKVGQPVP